MATNTAHLRPFFQASKRFFAKSISESTHDGSSAEMFFADATAAAASASPMNPLLFIEPFSGGFSKTQTKS